MNLDPLRQLLETNGLDFDRDRWKRTLNRTITDDELAHVCDQWPADTPINPRTVNDAARAHRAHNETAIDRTKGRAALQQLREEWDAANPDLAERRRIRNDRKKRDAEIERLRLARLQNRAG